MKIAIGCDIAGAGLRDVVMDHLRLSGFDVTDFGVNTEDIDYPEIAQEVSREVADGKYERAILICGTGIGMAIVANKVPGVRAAVCHDPYSAERARKSNDAQIMSMGARVIGPELAKTLTDIWMSSEFEGGGSTRKVEKIKRLDRDRAALASTGF